MNPKHEDWDWFGNTNKFNFHCLNFLVRMVEIFNSFNMEKTEGNELKFLKKNQCISYNKT